MLSLNIFFSIDYKRGGTDANDILDTEIDQVFSG